jgi:CRISPR-associated protein Cas2
LGLEAGANPELFIQLYKTAVFPYTITMFVAIAVDPGSKERAKELADLLAQYGFKTVQKGLWESSKISPDTLIRAKRDLDKLTDAFDRLRFFQYPMEGTLVLSSLKDKKWRRMVAKNLDSTETPAAPKAQPALMRQKPVAKKQIRKTR